MHTLNVNIEQTRPGKWHIHSAIPRLIDAGNTEWLPDFDYLRAHS